MIWYSENLVFDDKPDNVLVELKCIANFKYDIGKDKRTLDVRMVIRLTRDSETVEVAIKNKPIKVWQRETIDDIDIKDKFMWWVDKFKSSIRNFKDLIGKCAIKAETKGVMTWITSLTELWK